MEKLIPIGELFKKSWALYKTRWLKMLLMGLIGGIGSIVIGALGGLGAFTVFRLGNNQTTFNLTTVLIGLIGVLLLIVLNLWIHLALMYMVKEEYAQNSIWDTLMMVWDKMGGYSWVVILKGLTILVGCIALIVPGIIFAVWFAFSQYAFVIDNKHGKAALRFSRELVRGYWWPLCGRIVVLGVVALLISMLTRIGFLINALIIVPFSIVYLYTMYEDLKRVKNAALPMKVA
jgi:hypothetical protein